MSKLWRSLRGGNEERYTLNNWAQDKFAFNGLTYPILSTGANPTAEEIGHNFVGYVHGAYKSDGVVFSAIETRRLVFSSTRFVWQRFRNGQPGELFSTRELDLLHEPWPNGTSFELLSRMEQDISLSGNFYAVRERDRLRRLRPDWVSIVLDVPPAEAERSNIVGYRYAPGGDTGRVDPVVYSVEEVVHWAPTPDPEHQYIGMSWLTPVIREIQADKLATEHKLRFFENAATPNLAVSFKESVTREQFEGFMEAMNAAHNGVQNAYKTLYLGGGADVTPIGADLRQLDFKATQGAGENRIAVASGVPAVILGLSEGLQGSSLNSGNYSAAKRKFQDGFLHPQWQSAVAALASVLDSPGDDVRLWYDTRDIPFLRDDERDVADVQTRNAAALRQLVDAGFNANAAVEYLQTGDLSRLTGQHSGLFSVQLQPPGSGQETQGENE